MSEATSADYFGRLSVGKSVCPIRAAKGYDKKARDSEKKLYNISNKYKKITTIIL